MPMLKPGRGRWRVSVTCCLGSSRTKATGGASDYACVMSDPEPDRREPHLLVVDDDTRLAGLLRRYLTDNGFRVTIAGDASVARAAGGGGCVFPVFFLVLPRCDDAGREWARPDARLVPRRPRADPAVDRD